MTIIKTISDCAANGFIIIAEVDQNGELTKRVSIFNVASGSIEDSFASVVEAIATVNKVKRTHWEVLRELAYKGFIIIPKVGQDGELTTEFSILNLSTGLIQDSFSSFEEAKDEVDKAEVKLWEMLKKHAYDDFVIVAALDDHKNPKEKFSVFSGADVCLGTPHPLLEEAEDAIDKEVERLKKLKSNARPK